MYTLEIKEIRSSGVFLPLHFADQMKLQEQSEAHLSVTRAQPRAGPQGHTQMVDQHPHFVTCQQGQ